VTHSIPSRPRGSQLTAVSNFGAGLYGGCLLVMLVCGRASAQDAQAARTGAWSHASSFKT
jgi:hypothetical protein